MKKKSKVKTGVAIWISETGSIKRRLFSLGISKERKKAIIRFSPSESYKINRLNIRAGKVIIYKKADGNIVSQNPELWSRLDLNKSGVKTLRFNLQNSARQESKAAIYRWTTPKDAIDKLGPIFRLLFICIAIGVIGWASLKMAGVAMDTISSSRLMDCAKLLPKIADPIGAVVNNTVPIGAAA